MSFRYNDYLALLVGFGLGLLIAFVALPFWGKGVLGKGGPAASVNGPVGLQDGPGKTGGSDSGSPQAGALETMNGQIHSRDAVRRDSEIWIPRHVARRLSYSIGGISTVYKMDAEAQAVFAVDDVTKQKIEADTNALLEEIRKLETQKLQYLEQTQDSVLVKIPAGFAPESYLQGYRSQMEARMGKVKADLFLEKFLRELAEITTAFTGNDRLMRVSLQGEHGIITKIEQNDRTIEMNMLPDYLKHIVKVVEDKNRP